MFSSNKVTVKVSDDFWSRYKQLVRDEILPYQLQAMRNEIPGVPTSNAVENLRIAAGETSGDFYGMVFQDSDVAKWIEAAAYSLRGSPNPALEQEIDNLVDILAAAQQKDGYLNSFFTLMEPEQNRWSNLRDCHELYCAGHLIEAGVAYFQETGKRKLLEIGIRVADLIVETFGEEEGKLRGYAGHPEIELALVRLYEVTGDQQYLSLARFFLRERGTEPHYFDLEAERREGLKPQPIPFPVINPPDVTPDQLNYGLGYKFQQAHQPFLSQREAVGHAVRAGYLYSAAADVVAHTADEEIATALHALWQDVTERKMYITGCVGSQVPGESFTTAYDLPNEGMYCETCASVALVFLAKRMLNLEKKSQYADVMERALYNGTIAGMDLDGKAYFYINPQQYTQEMQGRVLGWEISQPRNRRLAWLDCACCPANLARLLASVDDYVYSSTEDEVYVNLFIGSEYENKDGWGFRLETDMPWGDKTRLTMNADGAKTLAFREPSWSSDMSITVNGSIIETELANGYRKIRRDWQVGDVVTVTFDISPRRVYANTKVNANVGRVALQRGPFVYAFEEVDNGDRLEQLRLPADAELQTEFWENELEGAVVIKAQARRVDNRNSDLYFSHAEPESEQEITAIPYYAWANRDEGEMKVWVRE